MYRLKSPLNKVKHLSLFTLMVISLFGALTQTTFKRGDFLRAEIILSSDLNQVDMGCDPMGIADSGIQTTANETREGRLM